MAPVRDAMIVAGGQGTRLRPLTLSRPKPLLPFCGAPFLRGLVRKVAAIGVERVFLVVGADTAPFSVLEQDARAVGVTVEIVPETKPLDTAGGVRAALDQVAGTFLVMNGDILSGLDLGALVTDHQAGGALATLALTRVDDTSSFGVCVLDGDRIVDFVEKPAPGSLPGQDAVNAGTYVLEPDAMARFPTGPLSFEREVFPRLVADGAPVRGFVSDAVWADLGTPERFLDGHRLVLDGATGWPGATDVLGDISEARARPDIEVPASAGIRGPVLLLPGTRVGEGAVIGPHVVTGEDVHIGDRARLRDSVIFDGVDVGPGAHVSGSIVGRHARIGADATIESGSVVGDEQHILEGWTLPAGSRVPDPDAP